MSENENSSLTDTRSWKNYTESQTHEKERFLLLLYELCQGVEEPEQEAGRARLLLKDMIFAMCFKVYSTLSARRFMSDLRKAHQEKLISHVPHFNSISNYFKAESVTSVLHTLNEESSSPLNTIETMFAVDSTGLGIPCHRKWYNRHKNRVQEKRAWRKLHCICGVQTNIITCAEVSDGHANDSPFFKDLVRQTAQRFKISEVSADAGYIGAHNQRQVLMLGAVPYIAYRSNSSRYGRPKSTFYKHMLDLFQERKAEFMDHYYRRNNIESTFFMLKARFGDRLRSKSARAQVNEALCKVICHNLCVLVQSMAELGLEPRFYTAAPAEKMHLNINTFQTALVQERIASLTVRVIQPHEEPAPNAIVAKENIGKIRQPLLPSLDKVLAEPLETEPAKVTRDNSKTQEAITTKRSRKKRVMNDQLLF